MSEYTEKQSDYMERVAHYLKGLSYVSPSACPGCAECGLDEESSDHERELADEPSFSWSACDSCGSRLGGDRHPAHALMPHDEGCATAIIHLDICTDCALYLANGEVPDDEYL